MPDTSTIICLCGLPGAGKTRHVQQVLSKEHPDALILCSDEIRASMGTYSTRMEHRVWGVIEHYARGCLLGGRDVIIDATNLTRDYRAHALWWAFEASARSECHYVQCTLEESVDRCRKWIGRREIEEMYARFEEPRKAEGWTKLYIIRRKEKE